MSLFNAHIKLTPLYVALALSMSSELAADFTILDGETKITTQTLNDNETGVIEAAGSLNTGGAFPSAVDASGINNVVTNNGSILASSKRRRVDAIGISSSGGNDTITNTGSISANTDIKGADAIGISSSGGNGTITNTGSISANTDI
jgi:hypothetical protein